VSDWREMSTADILTLGMAADQARRTLPNGGVVTYRRVHVVTADHLLESLTIPDGAAEVRLHSKPSTLAAALSQVEQLHSLAGSRRLAAFSYADLKAISGDLTATLTALSAAGLHDVAELPADLTDDLASAMRQLQQAGIEPSRITVARPIEGDRIALISRVQQAIEMFNGSTRFSPLPRTAPVDKPTTGYDDVRMVALARLALPSRSIEVDWSLYGPKLAQVALTFGADHLDAVPAVDRPELGPRRTTVEEVERNIRAAGFAAREVID